MRGGKGLVWFKSRPWSVGLVIQKFEAENATVAAMLDGEEELIT